MKRLAFLFTLVAAFFLMASSAFGAFKDVPANHWAYDELSELQELGIVEGYPGGYFKGDNTLTRYEMAVLVYRLRNQLEESLGSGDHVDSQARQSIERLANEFRDELNDFGARLDSVESQVDDNSSEIDKLKDLISTKGQTDYSIVTRSGYFLETPVDTEQDLAIDWAATINKSFDVDEYTDFNLSLTYAEDNGFGNNSIPGGNNESANPTITPGLTSSSGSFIVDNFNAEFDLHRWLPNFADEFTGTIGRQYFSFGKFGLAGENGFRSEFGTRFDASWNKWDAWLAGYRTETLTSSVPGGTLSYGGTANDPFGPNTRFSVGSLAQDASDFVILGTSYSQGTGDHPSHEDEWGFELNWVPEGEGHEHYAGLSAHAEILDDKWLTQAKGEVVHVFNNINDINPDDLGDSNDDGITSTSFIGELDVYNDGNTKVSVAGASIAQLEGLPTWANVDNNPFAEFEVTSSGGSFPYMNISRYGPNYFPADFVGGGLSAETTFGNRLYSRLTGYLGSRIDAVQDERPSAVRLDFRYPWTKSTTLGLDIITAGTTDNFEDSATQVRGSVNIDF